MFDVGKDRLGIVTAFLAMPDALLTQQILFCFLFVSFERVIDFDDAVAFALMAASPQRASFASLRLVARIGLHKSAFGFAL